MRYAIALVVLASCVNTTLITFEGSGCMAPSGTMNTYAVSLFSVPTTTPTPNKLCNVCVTMPQLCTLEQTTCGCSANVAATTDDLAAKVRGLGFSDVDSAKQYCVRIIGFMQPSPASSEGACDCPSDWQTAVKTEASVCVLSRLGSINDANETFVINNFSCRGQGGLFDPCVTAP